MIRNLFSRALSDSEDRVIPGARSWAHWLLDNWQDAWNDKLRAIERMGPSLIRAAADSVAELEAINAGLPEWLNQIEAVLLGERLTFDAGWVDLPAMKPLGTIKRLSIDRLEVTWNGATAGKTKRNGRPSKLMTAEIEAVEIDRQGATVQLVKSVLWVDIAPDQRVTWGE